MDPAVFVRSCEPTAESGRIDVVHEMPELLVLALHNIKALTAIKADSDHGDIGAIGMMLEFALAPVRRRVALTERESAIAALYFWLQKAGQLDGGIPSHPDFPLSAHLAERVNAVWRCAPELLGPSAHWQYQKVTQPAAMEGDPEQYVAEGRSIAETLARRDVVLDQSVLDAGAAAVLNEQLGAARCIGIARSAWGASALQHVTTLGPEPASRVHDSFATEVSLARLSEECAGAAILTKPEIHTVLSSRELLSGLAKSGASVPQVGWASGMRAVADDDSASNGTAALRALVVNLVSQASNGYHVSGYLSTVRDIGTIIGYGSSEADARALAVEFAGAFAVWMVEVADMKWPKRQGVPSLDPKLNARLAPLVNRVDGKSFIDGVLEYLADSGVDPYVGIAHLSNRNRERGLEPVTLDWVLRNTMPSGMHETYAAMFRARMMADTIAAQTDSKPAVSPEGSGRRRRVVV